MSARKPPRLPKSAKPIRYFSYPHVQSNVKLSPRLKLRRLLARHACEFLEELAKRGVLKFTHFAGQDIRGQDLSRPNWFKPATLPKGAQRGKDFEQILNYLHPLFTGRVVPVQLFQIIDQHSNAAVGKALKRAVEQRIGSLHSYNKHQYPVRRKIKDPELRKAARAHEGWARALGVPYRGKKS